MTHPPALGPAGRPSPPPGRTFWQALAMSVACVLAVAGLAVVAVIVLFIASLNTGGSNK